MGTKITFKTKPIEKKKPYNTSKAEVLENNNFLFTSDLDRKKRKVSLWD